MFKTVSRSGLGAGVALMVMLTAIASQAADETHHAWRLFVSDQQDARVTVIDLGKKVVTDRFSTTGYVTHLVPGESGKTLFAVQMDHDVAHVIKSGITLSSHGDHSDIEIENAALLPLSLEGKRPVHAVPHHGDMLLFFDGEGEARAYPEQKLLAGNTDHETIRATAPHHGVVVPMGDYFLVSEPNLDVETKPDSLPPRLGLKIVDQAGQQVGDIAICTGLHGEAHSAGLVGFGCEEGVIIASPDGGNAPKLDMLPYDKDMPEGRVSHLGGKAMQFFLGDYGSNRLVLIDPSDTVPYRVVDLPVRHVHFILDPVRVNIAYVFTEDGRLHALDVLGGKIIRSEQMTRPYSKDGHWRDPRPRLAIADDIIAVTDPREQRVLLVDAETFAQNGTIDVEGLPFNIVAIGGSGLSH